LGLGCSLGFSPLSFSTGFSLLAFSLSFPKNTFPEVLTNLIGFWKSFVCGENTGGAREIIFVVGFGGSGMFSPLPSPTLFAPSPLPSCLLNVSIITLN
jgi:hypothetical protein